MNNEFSYTYNARQNREVMDIRQKYLPREENKLDELKRLDDTVRNSGVMESLCVGIGGTLLFGLGMCLSMEVIGHRVWLGLILGAAGLAAMAAAFPVRRRLFQKAKQRYAPRILELTLELTGNHNSENNEMR